MTPRRASHADHSDVRSPCAKDTLRHWQGVLDAQRDAKRSLPTHGNPIVETSRARRPRTPAATTDPSEYDYCVRLRDADIDRGASVTKAEPEISAEYQRLDFVTAQPYPVWERARAECPVFESHGSSATTFTDRPQYHITRWDDVEQVLRDGQSFSSSINAEHIGQYMGELILAMDGKEHRAYRNLVAHAFRASQLEKWDDTLVRPAINRLLDDIAPTGRGDLVRDVTSRYPVQVICGIVGVPLEDSAQFHQWAEQINTGPLHPEVGMTASRRCARTSSPSSRTAGRTRRAT